MTRAAAAAHQGRSRLRADDRGRADCLSWPNASPRSSRPRGAGGAEAVDAAGRYLVPGFIDNHIHTLGGGGEAGPATRGPRLHAAQLLGCGITCGVGLLGVDGVSRRLEDLYAHTLGLREEGMAPTCSPARTTFHRRR